MAKLSVVPRSVNPFQPSISKQIEARIPCPWCGSQMYLDHLGERLLCVDTIPLRRCPECRSGPFWGRWSNMDHTQL